MPVGPSPFNPEFSDWYSKKRHSKNKSEFKKGLTDMTRQLKSNLTGDVYMLPKQDYEELVKYFNEHHSELSDVYKENGKQSYRKVQTPADFIDYAFESKRGQKQLVTQECAGGHIKKLTYNPLYMLLMVEFSNRGDICVFFNLPANVASTLMYLAEANVMAPPDKTGRERHAVGVEFWNLVRVRGSIHDTRFPFQYTNDMRTGRPFGREKGTGVHGEGNKYDYFNAEPSRRRFDKKTGEEIIRETVQKRDLREDQTLEQRENSKQWGREEQYYDAVNNVMDYDIDNLESYFDGNGNYYNNHLNKATPNQRKLLLKARQLYDQAANEDDIINTLVKTGLRFEKPDNLID